MSQLFLDEHRRAFFKDQIRILASAYRERLLPQFDHIEAEADSIAQRFYDTYPATEHTDGGDIAEAALQEGLRHYDYLRISRYVLTASWHVALYEAFEQQVRGFLFDEIGRRAGVIFRDFCENSKEIIEVFRYHGVDPCGLSTWAKISEMRLLCNVIKHSDGDSALKLHEVNPSLFKIEDGFEYIDLYRTTLLEETLAIDKTTLKEFENALYGFWDELPERSHSK
jgi:hypothetical protein